MQTHTLIQGSPEWLAHRAKYKNASDAPAMLGCSPYRTRQKLLKEMATGLTDEVDGATQARFDDGHRFEALARPLAEEIIGDDLAPVVGTDGEYGASFDGLTLMWDVASEHKTLNDELRSAFNAMTDLSTGGKDLPKHYRIQMEQQCMVAGCERVLFMATKWSRDEPPTLIEQRHCWYHPDPSLRAEIIAGWKQFAEDLAAWVPGSAPAAKLVAETVEALPAPVVQITGQLTLQDNFKTFENRLRDFLANHLIRKPTTDEDFVNLDAQIKAMKAGRAALKSAEAQMLAQVQPVDQASKTVAMLDLLLQQNCAMAEGLLKTEKDRRSGEIVAGGVAAFANHITALNKRLGRPYMPTIPVDFGGCIKGLKSITSMENKVDTHLATAKIAANEMADRIQVNLNTLRELTADHAALFPDAAAIVLKANDDLTALVQSRIMAHQQAEAARLEKERAKIAEEERVKAEAKARAEAAEFERLERAEIARLAKLNATMVVEAAKAPAPASAPAPAPVVAPPQAAMSPKPVSGTPPATAPTLRLGKICERLGFIVNAEFLLSIGIEPAARDRQAILFHEHQFEDIGVALIRHIESVMVTAPA